MNTLEILSRLASAVWGYPTIFLILGTGVYFTARLKLFQFVKIPHIFKSTIASALKEKRHKCADKGSISQLQAMTTALAGTIGTGNIIGVATAITIGGAGAVFWMWISACFGMMTAFAENVLGIYFRRKNSQGQWEGGPMAYIEHGAKSKVLACVFALLCTGASLGMGNMAQANSISTSLNVSFGIPQVVTGIICAVLLIPCIFGGIKSVGKVTQVLVPFMAIAYMLGGVVVLIMNSSMLSNAFSEIFSQAFSLDAAGGGAAGTIMSAALKTGFKRGVFTNEAGLGSSVLAHSASDTKEPVVQGMWAIFEVFVDTIVMCTLTALIILTTGAHKLNLDGAEIAIAAFSKGLGDFAGYFISIAISLFSFATMLGWSFFGTRAFEYLSKGKAGKVYPIVYLLVVVIGATIKLTVVWDISDILNGLMVVPNLLAVIMLSGTVRKITQNYLLRNASKANRKLNKTIKPPLMLSHFDDDKTG